MKKVRIICNLSLSIQAAIATLIITISCITMIILCGKNGIVDPPEDSLSVQIIWAVLLVGFYIGIFLSLPRLYSAITLSNEGITFKTLFHKSTLQSYNYYPYVYSAKYFHGNIAHIGHWVDFIVISHSPLTKEQLLQANHLSNSKDLIKIKFSQKTYEKLYDIFPSSHQNKLERAFRKDKTAAK